MLSKPLSFPSWLIRRYQRQRVLSVSVTLWWFWEQSSPVGSVIAMASTHHDFVDCHDNHGTRSEIHTQKRMINGQTAIAMVRCIHMRSRGNIRKASHLSDHMFEMCFEYREPFDLVTSVGLALPGSLQRPYYVMCLTRFAVCCHGCLKTCGVTCQP